MRESKQLRDFRLLGIQTDDTDYQSFLFQPADRSLQTGTRGHRPDFRYFSAPVRDRHRFSSPHLANDFPKLGLRLTAAKGMPPNLDP